MFVKSKVRKKVLRVFLSEDIPGNIIWIIDGNIFQNIVEILNSFWKVSRVFLSEDNAGKIIWIIDENIVKNIVEILNIFWKVSRVFLSEDIALRLMLDICKRGRGSTWSPLFD